jgi:hypothetical protein
MVPINHWALADYAPNKGFKAPNHKNMHPSVKYLSAKYVPSKFIRKGLRKWNVFWVRLNSGKVDPSGARNFAKKPKFDKKEKDIWNNKPREASPSTREDTTTSQAELPNEEGGNNE